ncbi:MAG: hypothetical protein WBI07_05830 [Mobilitalea sp.]
MLTPELQKLKEYLEGVHKELDKEKMLEELIQLDKIEVKALFESLSVSSEKCPTCGRKW